MFYIRDALDGYPASIYSYFSLKDFMINFKAIDFAYKQVKGSSYPTTVDPKNILSLLNLGSHFSNMIDAMLIANLVVIKAQRAVIELSLQQFSVPFEYGGFASHIKVAEFALQLKYGNISLEGENPIEEIDGDDPLYKSVKVVWKARMQFPTEADRNEHKNCLLFQAVIKAQPNRVKRLLEEGANPNAIGPLNRTPVYAIMQLPELVTILGLAGAKGDVKDKFGITPLQLAKAFDPNSEFTKNTVNYLR